MSIEIKKSEDRLRLTETDTRLWVISLPIPNYVKEYICMCITQYVSDVISSTGYNPDRIRRELSYTSEITDNFIIDIMGKLDIIAILKHHMATLKNIDDKHS